MQQHELNGEGSEPQRRYQPTVDLRQAPTDDERDIWQGRQEVPGLPCRAQRKDHDHCDDLQRRFGDSSITFRFASPISHPTRILRYSIKGPIRSTNLAASRSEETKGTGATQMFKVGAEPRKSEKVERNFPLHQGL
jgi:hypothetical protein